jgi:hypothetical protein
LTPILDAPLPAGETASQPAPADVPDRQARQDLQGTKAALLVVLVLGVVGLSLVWVLTHAVLPTVLGLLLLLLFAAIALSPASKLPTAGDGNPLPARSEPQPAGTSWHPILVALVAFPLIVMAGFIFFFLACIAQMSHGPLH